MSRITSPLSRLLAAAIAFGALVCALPASAQKEAPAPVDHYICPNAGSPKAVDCFLNAVDHLYTMCRHVKSIEVIEFGYEKSQEGVNGAKSEYCIDKQKASMIRPYQAAVKEVGGSRVAADQLKALYEQWQKSLYALKWQRGESDNEYKDRTVLVYVIFSEQATGVHLALADAGSAKAAPKPAATKGKAPDKTPAAPAAAKAKTAATTPAKSQ